MRKQIIPAAFGSLFALSVLAAEGEPGGAYGGDTLGGSRPASFEEVDQNQDGKVDKEEARAVGIEHFSHRDLNANGTLEKAEFSALMEESPKYTEPLQSPEKSR